MLLHTRRDVLVESKQGGGNHEIDHKPWVHEQRFEPVNAKIFNFAPIELQKPQKHSKCKIYGCVRHAIGIVTNDANSWTVQNNTL